MGYCISMEVCKLVIAKENVSKALEAINALHAPALMKKQAGGGSWHPNGDRTYHYSWVDQPPEGGFKDLVSAFDAWRYTAAVNDDGSVTVMHFDGEKLGDCQYLWTALQKLVPPTAEIRCRGEDGMQWKWKFKGGKFDEVAGKVVWEDEG
jgi:hypothetical protein